MHSKALAAVLFLLTVTIVAAQSVVYLPVIVKDSPPVKKGVAVFGPYFNTGCQDTTALGAAWWYNWWDIPNGDCSAGFIPMLYDDRMLADPWHVANLLRYGAASGWILGYNEPNLSGQGNVSPRAGAIGWRQLEKLVEGTGIKLVSPAPSQHAPGELDPYGYTWLLAMTGEYERLYGNKPRFDAIAWHYYGSTSETKSYLSVRHTEFEQLYPGVPVWLTEFNPCLLSNQDWQSFMGDVLPWLESQPWIGRYYWFLNRPASEFQETYSPCTLLTVDGELTAAGIGYRGY